MMSVRKNEDSISSSSAAAVTATSGEEQSKINGIIFRRNIRASYVTIDIVVPVGNVNNANHLLVVTEDTNKNISKSDSIFNHSIETHDNHNNNDNKYEQHIIVLLQFQHLFTCTNTADHGDDNNKLHNPQPTIISQIRSYFRRGCKLGDHVEFYDGKWLNSKRPMTQDMNPHSATITDNHNNRNELHRRYYEIVLPFHVKDNIQNSSSNQNIDHQVMERVMKIVTIQEWSLKQCQNVRIKYYPNFFDNNTTHISNKNKKRTTSTITNHDSIMNDGQQKLKNEIMKTSSSIIQNEEAITDSTPIHPLTIKGNQSISRHGGGGLTKQKRGKIVAEFLVQIVINKILSSVTYYDENKARQKAIEMLNSGSGVIDAAGGSGHVSLALSLKGIHSTVIDPRSNVGKLPGKDRSILKKALRKQNQVGDVPKVIPFSTLRAWFVRRPEGVDITFREASKQNKDNYDNDGKYETCLDDVLSMKNAITTTSTTACNGNSDENINNSMSMTFDCIPICTMCSPDRLLPSCSAIIALHPDEATGDIVDFAVQHQIPFVVVPCCVFGRLFPDRKIPNSNHTVSTYEDLIEYLMHKHDSIQCTKLDFDGANLALWSTFS